MKKGMTTYIALKKNNLQMTVRKSFGNPSNIRILAKIINKCTIK